MQPKPFHTSTARDATVPPPARTACAAGPTPISRRPQARGGSRTSAWPRASQWCPHGRWGMARCSAARSRSSRSPPPRSSRAGPSEGGRAAAAGEFGGKFGMPGLPPPPPYVSSDEDEGEEAGTAAGGGARAPAASASASAPAPPPPVSATADGATLGNAAGVCARREQLATSVAQSSGKTPSGRPLGSAGGGGLEDAAAAAEAMELLQAHRPGDPLPKEFDFDRLCAQIAASESRAGGWRVRVRRRAPAHRRLGRRGPQHDGGSHRRGGGGTRPGGARAAHGEGVRRTRRGECRGRGARGRGRRRRGGRRRPRGGCGMAALGPE